MDELGGEVNFPHDIAALLPEEAKSYEGVSGAGERGVARLAGLGVKGLAPDSQHGGALAKQVSQGEPLKL